MDFINPTSGFIGIGEALGRGFSSVFRNDFGTPTPKATPINPTSFSFDFAGAAQKLLQPFRQATDPRAAAGSNIITAAGDATAQILRTAGSKVSQMLTDSNKKKETATVQPVTLSQVSAAGPSLGDILKTFSNAPLLNNTNSAIPLSNDAAQIASQAASTSRNSVLLVGGALLALTLLTITKERSK